MTNEKAIEELKAIKSVYSNNLFGDAKLMKSEQDALDMAIKALEQEPSGDLISRDMALEKMADYVASGYADSAEDFEEYSKIICQLPPVNPQPCDDTISRETVIDAIGRVGMCKCSTDEIETVDECLRVVKALSPVTAEPKTGHWEWVQYDYNPKIGNWHCSECRCIVVECVGKKEKGGIPLYKYCPQCGAKMVEPQESEDEG